MCLSYIFAAVSAFVPSAMQEKGASRWQFDKPEVLQRLAAHRKAQEHYPGP
jgi:hypothetical protein